MTVKGRESQLRCANNFAHLIMSSDKVTPLEVNEYGDFGELNRRPRFYSASCEVFFGSANPKSTQFVGRVNHQFDPDQKLSWEAFVVGIHESIVNSCGASKVQFVASVKVLIRNHAKGG